MKGGLLTSGGNAAEFGGCYARIMGGPTDHWARSHQPLGPTGMGVYGDMTSGDGGGDVTNEGKDGEMRKDWGLGHAKMAIQMGTPLCLVCLGWTGLCLSWGGR